MAKDRLYYYDPKLLEFDADVISCEGPCACANSAESWQVQLSPNAFYPESGGQPSDRGKVAGADVIDVTEDSEGRVIVLTSGPVSGRVRCSIDGHRRFDLMQQHTGQHILSAAFERLFGFETVGFHLGEEYCTVDLDTDKLEEWQADKAEDVSNDIVTKDVPVVAEFVDADRLKAMNLRKAPKVVSDIRIVSVQGFDNCPCGGTHVAHTGEIGLIKITRIDRAKGKVRLELLCGMRALVDYRNKNRQLARAASSLSVHPMELEQQIERMLGQLKDTRKSLQDASQRLMEYDAIRIWDQAEAYSGVKVIVHNAGQGNMDTAKLFALKLVGNPLTAAVVGSFNQDNAYLVVARSQDTSLDAAAAFKSAIVLLEGKGGGNQGMAQGGGAKVPSLDEALKTSHDHLVSQLS